MICPADNWSNGEYLTRFRNRILDKRVPVNCSIDLTNHCNFKCLHCYIRDESGPDEMTTEEACRIMDEAADLGSLFLLFTGGEPLLRDDFEYLYRYAKQKGFYVSVFTNGSLVTVDILDLFEELPPWAVEVTLYGATNKTYQAITGRYGVFDAVISGIENMHDRGVSLGLKTVLMTLNNDEFYDIRGIAQKFGVNFHFDSMIFPKINGDDGPLRLRVDSEESVKKEFSDNATRKQWHEAIIAGGTGAVSDKLYLCGAGVTGFHVTADCMLRPCMMVTDIEYDLRTGNMHDGWATITERIDSALAPAQLVCRDCDKKNLCGYCPGTMLLEQGGYLEKQEYACRMGSERFNEVMKNGEVKASYEQRHTAEEQKAV